MPALIALMSFSIERAGGDAAGVERTHGELRAGLADGLGGDDADRQAFFDELAGGHVHAVAAGADAARAFAGQRAADADRFDAQFLELVGDLVGDRSGFPRRSSRR